MKEFEKAIADYDRAIAESSELANAFLNRGMLRKRKKEYALALGDFLEVHRLEPTNHIACYQAAECLSPLGRKEEAGEWLTRAIEQQPTYWKASYRRARRRSDGGGHGGSRIRHTAEPPIRARIPLAWYDTRRPGKAQGGPIRAVHMRTT